MGLKKTDKYLYRYMSFHSFVDLVLTSTLKLVRPRLWEDPYEGYLFQKIRSPEGKNEILKIINKIPPNPATDSLLGVAEMFEKTFYAQSWSKCAESDAMWRIYNYENKTIRIEVLESNIRLIENIEIIDIDYNDSINLESEIDKLCLQDSKLDFSQLYSIKRTAFSHEQEVRLIYRDHNVLNEKTPEEIETFKGLIGTKFEQVYHDLKKNSLYKSSDISIIKIEDINTFINSVLLHPQSSDWFDHTLELFCTECNLNYLGKSKLYENIK